MEAKKRNLGQKGPTKKLKKTASIEQPNKDIQGELLLTGSTLTGETDTSKTEAGPIQSEDEAYDFYVMSDNAEWEKTTITELEKRRQGIRCISRNEWIPGKYKLDNLIEPVNICKKVVVGFAPSPAIGSTNYLAQSVVQRMLDENSTGKLIPVRISEDSIIPEALNVLHSANGWEDNLCEKLFFALDAMAAGKSSYTLEGSKDEQISCPSHGKNLLEFYCSTCKKSACEDCKHVIRCYQNNHNVIPMKTAVHEFNQNATEVMNIAQGIQIKLKGTLDVINNDRSDFEHHLKLCKQAIEVKEKALINKIKEKGKKLISDFEEIYKEKKNVVDSQVKNIDTKLTKVNNVMASISTMMNKPQETETLEYHKTTINTVRDEILGTDFDKSFHKKNITPTFIPSTHLDEVMNTECIGKITTVDGIYKVDQDDEAITVTKGQTFVVTVSSLSESDASKLSATLSNPSHEESATEVEYQGNGEYKITGKCNVEGDWQMKIIAGEAHIKGSPVNIKVEALGLVHTIGNISDYKEHMKENKVTDVVLDTDGCILVSSASKDILKFNQSGSFVAKIQVPQNVQVDSMHLMCDGHMVYSDFLGKCVVMCDDKFKEIISFGKGKLKYPWGLTVNKKTGVLYVTDSEAHCVFKFNVDDGRLLGKIGSEGSEVGQMNKPNVVTLTKEGHMIIADFANSRIQMFDANDKFMRILVGCGKEDGKIWAPCGVTMDMDENIIVSSNHKLQLFDKNGVFIKRIDHKDDGLDIPAGISVISNRPRRVAVANHNANNVKSFNY
ncbi:E3 ubiquitin-protein ligase TRIM71-like isoform X2 [Anneissia japonica]|uniref:E3 ubiquitin-protein ligase TRIM71-like isoform X2 n=1 Tax=Anneissia japonica TaxID=1529436 RepID=UPI001425A075|nr:E3 ubiquitin-protein ligase TRIM71-like isoform X2 [Anneissia japonica]